MLFHTYFTMVFLCLFPVWTYRRKIPPFLTFFWGYFIFHATFTAYGPWYFPGYSPSILPQVTWTATQDLLQMILIPMFVLHVRTSRLMWYLKWICAANLVFIIATKPWMAAWYTGNTMDMAIITFFTFMWENRILQGLNVIGLMVVGGTTAGLMTVAQAAVHLRKYWRITLPLGLAGLVAVWMIKRSVFFPSDRMWIWDYSMQWWHDFGDPFFGEGMGAYSWIGPILGQKHGTHQFMWMHSDWLQLLFDGGYVSLVLAVILAGVSIKKAWHNNYLLGQILAYMICMTFYSPLRTIIGQVILTVFIKEVWIAKRGHRKLPEVQKGKTVLGEEATPPMP
jgi:hypothetical protein